MICNSINNFCCEDISLIENYEKAVNDQTQTWDCHHRLETDENKSQQQLIDEDRYYNRPAKELIFLTRSEHANMHYKGTHRSKETKRKISEKMNGTHRSEETKRKISEGRKRKNSAKGRMYINNGIDNKMIYESELEYYLSIGYKRGRLKTW